MWWRSSSPAVWSAGRSGCNRAWRTTAWVWRWAMAGGRREGVVGGGVGCSAYALRLTSTPNGAGGATVRKLGRSFPLACTQQHWSMEGRPIVREANLETFRSHPDFAKKEKLEEPPVVTSLYPN